MITLKYFCYGVLAVIVGAILAFGISGVLYHPLPITATVRDYSPAPAPTVITTAPTVTVTPGQTTMDTSHQESDTRSSVNWWQQHAPSYALAILFMAIIYGIVMTLAKPD